MRKNIRFLFSFTAAFVAAALCARAEVTVSNVSVGQQPGAKRMRITYEVESTKTATVEVTLDVTDEGTPVPANTLSGDVGSEISIGTGKEILWNMEADWNGNAAELLYTVTADDGEGDGEDGGEMPEGFVRVEGGTFTMGDTWGGGYSNETPTHAVTVSSFHMSRTEVTNQQVAEVFQWAYDNGKITANSKTAQNASDNSKELLDLDDSDCQIRFSNATFSVKDGKEKYPCVEISWYGAAAYCNFLSQQESRTPCYDFSDWSSCDWSADGYRLPTEAEWEYAARGGQADTDPGGDSDHKHAGTDEDTSLGDVAWYWHNSDAPGNSGFYRDKGTLPVGQKTANELGLYDLTGNVWEWCWDRYGSGYYSDSPGTDPRGPVSGSDRVLRGGDWFHDAEFCRVSYRGRHPPGYSDYFGFRPVRPASQ